MDSFGAAAAAKGVGLGITNACGINLRAPVYLNIYDLTPINGYMYWFGLGMFHSGIEVHGTEYSFGAHEYSTSGVFEVVPRSCPGFSFRKAILLGRTDLSPLQFRNFIQELSTSYSGDSYHLMLKNCNHFTNDVSLRLTGSSIPRWVNRLARIGMCSFGSCIMCCRLRVHHQNPMLKLARDDHHRINDSSNSSSSNKNNKSKTA